MLSLLTLITASVNIIQDQDLLPGWDLTWSDEFDGVTLDSKKWNVYDNQIHGDEELQLYVARGISVGGGLLTINTRNDPVWCAPKSFSSCPPAAPASPGSKLYNYTSGWVDTSGKFSQVFGKFVVRARLPDPRSYAIWPAHWLVPDPATASPPDICWPDGGEIDIMEGDGFCTDSSGYVRNGTVSGTYHWGTACGVDLHCGGSGPKHCSPYAFNGQYPDTRTGAAQIDFSQEFHTFSVEWNATSIRWFVDDIFFWERQNGDRPGRNDSAAISSQPMYLILNTAVAPGRIPVPGDPTDMLMPVAQQIDYVRVYSKSKEEEPRLTGREARRAGTVH